MLVEKWSLLVDVLVQRQLLEPVIHSVVTLVAVAVNYTDLAVLGNDHCLVIDNPQIRVDLIQPLFIKVVSDEVGLVLYSAFLVDPSEVESAFTD